MTKPADLTNMPDLLKNKLNPKLQETTNTPVPVETSKPKAQALEQKFQHYHSSRISMRLVTTTGKRITFTGFEFITQDEDIIDYLNSEIDQGLPGIAKGKFMTAAEADPMEALRRKHFEEFKVAQVQEAADKAAGITREMGETEGSQGKMLGAAGSGQVAN